MHSLFPLFPAHDETNPPPSHERRKRKITEPSRRKRSQPRTGAKICVHHFATVLATIHDTSTRTRSGKDENRNALFDNHVTNENERNNNGRRNRERKGHQVQWDRRWPSTRISQETVDLPCSYVLHPIEKQKQSRACVMRDSKQEHCRPRNNPSRSTNRFTYNT